MGCANGGPSSTPAKSLRTAVPERRGRRDREMHVDERVYPLGLLVLLSPLIPIGIAIWAGWKLRGRIAGSRG